MHINHRCENERLTRCVRSQLRSLSRSSSGRLVALQSGSIQSFQFKSHLCSSVRAPQETTNLMMSMSLPMCLHLLQAPIPSGRNVLDVDKKSLFCSQEIYQELYNTNETTTIANRGKGRYLKSVRHYLINSICCNFINTIKLTLHTLCVVFILKRKDGSC